MGVLGSTIRAGLTKPLRLVFRSSAVPAEVEPLPPVETAPPEVDFVAYAEDCILSGRVRLAADRLSDLVNAHETLELIDVLVTDLVGGAAIEVHQLLISREEILVLHATGPRGRSDRRQRMRQHPVVAKLGPYEVRGYIHALPGSDPIAGLRRRPPIVALTDALIEYSIGKESIRRRVSTVLINRELTDWIVEGEDETDELDKIEFPIEDGPLVKDFTGSILGRRAGADDEAAVEPARELEPAADDRVTEAPVAGAA
jgi:hypothetical protein